MKCSVLILPLLAGFAAWGQQLPPAPASQPTLVLKATTRLVQVSVVAHDRKGNPIADLKKEDFTIKVNGKEQPIQFFEMQSSANLPQTEEKLPPNMFTNRLQARSGTPNSVTIILLDSLNTHYTDQAYAKAQVVKFIREQVRPEDHIGIYTLGGTLRVLHDYTTDSTRLLDHLSKFNGELAADPSSAESERELMDLNSSLSRSDGSSLERNFYLTNRVLGTLKSIEFIANHLSKVPGRKNLVWVSGGFPLSVGFEDMESWNNPALDHRIFGDELSRTLKAVNDANMAIYPVDARGLVPDKSFDASKRSIDVRANQNRLNMGPVVEHQQTMEALAGGTGGRAFYNTNDLKGAVREAIADSQVTYTLAFYPQDEKFDRKYHKIKISIDRPEAKLRYRNGFLDAPEMPQDDKARKQELYDAVWSPIDATGIPMIVQVLPGKTPGTFDVAMKVSTSDVSLQQQAERWAGRLDVVFIQRNKEGKQFNGIDDVVQLNLTEPTYRKLVENGIVYHRVIQRSGAANQLRVVLRDGASGSIGSVTVPFADLKTGS